MRLVQIVAHVLHFSTQLSQIPIESSGCSESKSTNCNVEVIQILQRLVYFNQPYNSTFRILSY